MGLLVFHEPMPQARLAGFALVWLALVVFTLDAARTARSRRLTSGDPAEVSLDLAENAEAADGVKAAEPQRAAARTAT
jgi:chloramphenicol-sensitive protein RarD